MFKGMGVFDAHSFVRNRNWAFFKSVQQGL